MKIELCENDDIKIAFIDDWFYQKTFGGPPKTMRRFDRARVHYPNQIISVVWQYFWLDKSNIMQSISSETSTADVDSWYEALEIAKLITAPTNGLAKPKRL